VLCFDKIIVGGGPCGIVLALYLSQKKFQVSIYEKSHDPKIKSVPIQRAANLDLSARGLLALSEVGLLEQVLSVAIPTYGRVIHLPNDKQFTQDYDVVHQKPVYSISRERLNDLLLKSIEGNPFIKLHFDHALISANFSEKSFLFEDRHKKEKVEIKSNWVFGCDGAFSRVREELSKIFPDNTNKLIFSHSYKEINFPYSFSKNLSNRHMHRWPRSNLSLVAHPNLDGSFTGTLILPNTGENSFANLTNKLAVQKFFNHYFADLSPIIPELTEQFFDQPIGQLATISVKKQQYKNALLLGDAAHTMLPFGGQGVNCALEDVRLLNELISRHPGRELENLMSSFALRRKSDTDAILEISSNKYIELNADYAPEKHMWMIELEKMLAERYPGLFIPYRNLIWFDHTAYSHAKQYRDIQLKLFSHIISSFRTIQEIKWEIVDKWMVDYEKDFLQITPDCE